MKRVYFWVTAVLALLMLLPLGAVAADIKPDVTIAVKEDTYVLNTDSSGDRTNDNFGGDKELNLKSNNGGLTRFSILKFDVSSLAGKTDFTCIDLDLNLVFRQNDTDIGATVEVYGCPNGWAETTATYNNQPETYGLAGFTKEIFVKNGLYSISVTDYVRQALANGEKEISLYLKEATDEKPLHIKFASKEAGASTAPKLSVYYGTKTDNFKYDGGVTELIELPELSDDGLDAIFGHKVSRSAKIDVKEDTYVEGGASENTNFGASERLDFKAPSAPDNFKLYRSTLLKFDISEYKNENIQSARLTMYCTLMENKEIPTTVHLYGCSPQTWDENTVTFNTAPEKEDYIATAVVSQLGEIYFDITHYVNLCQKYGDVEIAFRLEGDEGSIRRLYFASKEHSEPENASFISVIYGDSSYTTDLKFTDENPWQVAMENYSDWYHRWEKIKQGGTEDVELVERVDEEYAFITDATYGSETDGYNTRYRQFETRIVDTLKGYTEDKSEIAIYDVYGGLIDESMRQKATGYFYTVKIGDRWWNIDPLGYPYYRVACVQMSPGGSPNQKTLVLSKFGSKENWADSASKRLYELGFNAAGAWCDADSLVKAEQPLSLSHLFYALRDYSKAVGLDATTSGHTEFYQGILPVFDPDFIPSARKTVEAKTKNFIGSPYIYGWFSDNELTAELNMLDNTLKADPTDNRLVYSYAMAWTFMYMKTGNPDVGLGDVTDELRKEYRAMMFDKYYNVVTDAMERYVPMHQYIGCRLVRSSFTDEMVMRVSGYYCDVISLNYYSVWQGEPEVMANLERWADKPFIVTEWYAKGMDVWEKDNRMINVSGAGWTVRTQKDRGNFYQNFALQLLECKGCVGFDWFQYWDNDPDNLAADLSNRDSNKGIYNNRIEEYTELTNIMADLNHQKYNLVKFFDGRNK